MTKSKEAPSTTVKQRGGSREHAGRKAQYGEPTTTMRVPMSAKGEVRALLDRRAGGGAADTDKGFNLLEWADLRIPDLSAQPLALPLGMSKVSAGFPSPAEDYEDRRLDINEFLVSRPAATFFFPVQGDSMTAFGIHDGDFLVCDRSVQARSGDVVIAFVGGDRLVKQLSIAQGRYRLLAGNPSYPPLEITEGMDFEIWGVVVGRFARMERLARSK